MFMTVIMIAAAFGGASVGHAPHVLTTGELKSHLIGFTIIRPDLPKGQSFSDDPEQFDPNGDYVRYGDNVESQGTYTIKNDQVCTRLAKQEESCGFIILDQSGTYWLIRSLWPAHYKQISFIKTQR